LFAIGLESDPPIRNLFPEFEGFGRLIPVTPGGQWSFVADLSRTRGNSTRTGVWRTALIPT
jgi:hypothetical protein